MAGWLKWIKYSWKGLLVWSIAVGALVFISNADAAKATCLPPGTFLVCDQMYRSSQGVVSYYCLGIDGKQHVFIDGGSA